MLVRFLLSYKACVQPVYTSTLLRAPVYTCVFVCVCAGVYIYISPLLTLGMLCTRDNDKPTYGTRIQYVSSYLQVWCN